MMKEMEKTGLYSRIEGLSVTVTGLESSLYPWKTNLNENSKIIAFWLNNEENVEMNLPKNVIEIIEKYKNKEK